MKTNYILFSILMSVFMLACSDDKDVIDMATAPRLEASTPAQGDKCAYDSIGITLNFNTKVITSSNGASLSIDGATVNWLSGIGSDKITVSVKNLVASHNYVLNIPAGFFLNAKTFAPCEAISLSFTTEDASLSNQNAIRQALNVYNYLQSVYGEKILSATMAQVDWNTDNANAVYDAFGRYPAMAFFDYLHLASSPSNWIDYGNITPVADYWNAGGIVGACWHWNVPKCEGSAELTSTASETTFSVTRALMPNTWEHEVLTADLAKMAGYLKLLQDRNIALIWRPLHEAAGNIYEYEGGEAWFWWGKEGAAQFKLLWKYMYDYFAAEGVNNLIWVWTSQVKDKDFYPGAQYVDIVGRDIYNESEVGKIVHDFNSIREQYPGKMVVLSEMGNLAALSQQWAAGAHWGWFMPWYGAGASLDGNDHADRHWWADALAMPEVITRDQLPNFNN